MGYRVVCIPFRRELIVGTHSYTLCNSGGLAVPVVCNRTGTAVCSKTLTCMDVRWFIDSIFLEAAIKGDISPLDLTHTTILYSRTVICI